MAESREQIAQREVGHTDIQRWLSRALTAVFLITISVVPAVQTANDFHQARTGERDHLLPQSADALRLPLVGFRAFSAADGGPFDRLFAANREVLRAIHSFEDAFEKRSLVGEKLRKRLQGPLTRSLGVGNEQVYCGRSNWLFFRPAVDHLTGPGFLDEHRLARRAAAGNEWQEAPQPNPLPTILEFRDQLAERGIELLILPVPVKASVHPDHFSKRYSSRDTSIHNPSFTEFLVELENSGIRIFDPSPVLLEAAASSGEAQYLETDTHWTPQAVNLVAKELAITVREIVDLSNENPIQYSSRKASVENVGDLAQMLELSALFPSQTVSTGVVEEPKTETSHAAGHAEVLLLGDSFANIYQQRGLGWGENAGLARRLAFHLRQPVEAIIRNDDGAFATRLLLSQQVQQDSGRLAATRVLIWEFTARELSEGDWHSIPMALPAIGESNFVVPPSGTTVVVEGTVGALSEVPNPRTAPYADFIVGLHLVDLTSDEVLDGDQALIFTWAMRNRQLLDGASYRVGQRLRMELRPWVDVSGEVGSITRGEIYENNVFLQTPCWGEEVVP